MSELVIKNNLKTELSIKHTNGYGAKSLGSQDFKYIRDTIKDLNTIIPNDNEVVLVKGYHEIGDGGGGLFVYSASEPKSNHNGGTVIDSSKVFPGDWANQTELTDWFTGSNTTNGCWKRIFDGSVNVKWFGAVGNSMTDDTIALEKCISNFNNINILDGKFLYSKDLSFNKNELIISGNGVLVSDDKIDNNNNPTVYTITFTGSDIHIKNIKIERKTYVFFSNLEASDWLLKLEQVDNFSLRKIEITGVTNWTIALLGCSNGIVDDCYIHDTGKDGIHLIGGKNIKLINNTFSNILDDKIALEDNQDFPQYGRLENIIVSNNTIENYPIGRGVYCVGGKNISIVDNKIDTNFDATCVQYFSDSSVDPNTLSNECIFIGQRYSTRYGQSYRQEKVLIKGNSLISDISDSRSGIQCEAGTKEIIISNNTFYGKSTSIVFSNDENNPTLTEDVIFTNNIIDSVKVGIASNNNSLKNIKISNNIFKNIRTHGIYMIIGNPDNNNNVLGNISIINNKINYESIPLSSARGIYVYGKSIVNILNNNLSILTSDTSGNLTREIRIDKNINGEYLIRNNICDFVNIYNSNANEIRLKKSNLIFVDQINGNDDNNGTEVFPFKTIKKAILSVPDNNLYYIRLLSDVDLNNFITLQNRNIYIQLNGHNFNVLTTAQSRLYSIYLETGELIFDGQNISGSKITLPNQTSDSSDNNNHPALLMAGANGIGFRGLHLKYGVDVVVNDSQYHLFELNDKGAGAYTIQGTLTDNTGDNLTWADLIIGVVKDSNGVPRNVISNIII